MRGFLVVVLVLLWTGTRSAPDPYEANPFYVDESSVHKEQYKWTMKLKNHHPAGEATANPEIRLGGVSIESLDRSLLRFKMTDAEAERWEPKLLNKAETGYNPAPMEEMGFKYENDPFGFQIIDPATQEIVVSTLKGTNSSLKFFDKYLELGMWFTNQRIFGLGERVTPEFQLCPKRDWCVYTIFNKDQISPVDTGEKSGQQVYGHHPFYMIQLKNGLFIAVLFLNSNAQDAVLVKSPIGTLNVYHKSVGGIFDMYFFYPGKAETVLQNYHRLIGRPYIAPFWSLGFHQCRYGWESLSVVQEVVAKFEETDIPLEVVWADIDYMKDYADFTIDPVHYKGLGQFVDTLHSKSMRCHPLLSISLYCNYIELSVI